jgi:peptidoglycan/LPS O-acetylase OafA/YrhL
MFQPQISWQAVKVFWINRWLRTLPAYLVAFGIYYYFSGYIPNRFFYLFFAQNIVTPTPGFFPHSWSLAVEEWFYLLFPLTMMAIAGIMRNYRDRDRIYLTCVVLFLATGIFTKLVYHWLYQQDLFAILLEKNLLLPSWKTFVTPVGNWDGMRKIVPFRLDAIAYGCLVAYLLAKYKLTEKARIGLLIAGTTGIMVCFQIIAHTVAGNKANIFVDVLLLPLFCCSFALMLPYARFCPRPGKIVVRVITRISQTSYSFYLLHLLVLEFVIGFYETRPFMAAMPKWIIFAGTYLFIYLISYLMYTFIESPFMNYRQKLFPNSTHVKRL